MREERYQVKSVRAGLVLAGLAGEDQHQVDRQGQEGQHQAESSQQGQRDLEDQDQEHQHHGGDGGQEVRHGHQEEGEADGQADGDCLDGGEAGAGDEEEESEERQTQDDQWAVDRDPGLGGRHEGAEREREEPGRGEEESEPGVPEPVPERHQSPHRHDSLYPLPRQEYSHIFVTERLHLAVGAAQTSEIILTSEKQLKIKLKLFSYGWTEWKKVFLHWSPFVRGRFLPLGYGTELELRKILNFLWSICVKGWEEWCYDLQVVGQVLWALQSRLRGYFIELQIHSQALNIQGRSPDHLLDMAHLAQLLHN